MSKLRFRMSMSLDGFTAGPNQSGDNPLGVGGMRLHEWAFPTAAFREMHGLDGGEVNESDAIIRESFANLGATIMGRNMFGGHPGPWKARDPWQGWWGKNPPYHHPVFVLTHHAREPLTLEGGNVFHFVTDGIESALAQALLLHTGQRRADVIRMGRQHIKESFLNVRQQKTGAELAIPVQAELQAIISATTIGQMTFLITEQGKPFTAAGFGNWFRDQCNAAGLEHCSAHGLRKAAARRLAEAECTTHEIAAITGHKSLREVARYTEAADQKRLATSAMAKTKSRTAIG